MIKNKDAYQMLNSNEIGCLLANYILSERKESGTLPQNPLLLKTIVTGKLVEKIAQKYHCQIINVHTGFKNIASVISDLDLKGQAGRFVLPVRKATVFLAVIMCGIKTRL
jgi:phosphoglucomutase